MCGETTSRTRLAAPTGSTAPRPQQFGGKIVSFSFFLTRIFSRKSGQPGDLFLSRLHMRPNGVSDASRSTAKFHCPQAPAIWGENCELLIFFLTRLFSRSSGHPGDRCLSQVNMRRNDVSDASRSTDRFHCPQGPTIWGENRELLFFFDDNFFKKVWAARRPVPESAAYEAKRRLGRVSQHRKVPLPPGPSNLGGKLRAVNFFF